MAASLSTIAPEIVLPLIPFLNNRDLSRLSRTCRKLHELALQYVYDGIHWEYNVHRRAPPSYLLLRTLLQRPIYDSFVKHVGFQCQQNAPRYVPVLGFPLSLPGSSMAIIEYHLPQAHKHLPNLWKHQLANGDIGACVAMILAFLPGLETLCLESFFVDVRCLAGLFSSPNNFLKLRQVLLDGRSFTQSGCDRDQKFWHRRYFLRLFELPSLVKAAINFPVMPQGRLPLPAEWPMLRSLTMLQLPHCHSPPLVLEHILKSSPPLKTLIHSYNAPELELDQIEKQMVDLTSLSRAIEQVSKTLRSLYLGVNFDATVSQLDVPGLANGPFQGLTMSLEQCERLERLYIPLMMLVDWHGTSDLSLASKLSRSLKTLDLRDKEMGWRGCHMTPDDLVGMIEELLEEKANGTREAFESVMFEIWSVNVGWRRQDLRYLGEICSNSGVKTGSRALKPSEEAIWERRRPYGEMWSLRGVNPGGTVRVSLHCRDEKDSRQPLRSSNFDVAIFGQHPRLRADRVSETLQLSSLLGSSSPYSPSIGTTISRLRWTHPLSHDKIRTRLTTRSHITIKMQSG